MGVIKRHQLSLLPGIRHGGPGKTLTLLPCNMRESREPSGKVNGPVPLAFMAKPWASFKRTIWALISPDSISKLDGIGASGLQRKIPSPEVYGTVVMKVASILNIRPKRFVYHTQIRGSQRNQGS